MKTRNMVITSLLMAIGLVLHAITPPVFMGIKPDFLLSCMFISLIINSSKINTITTGIIAGLMSAFTTGFPMGQIPNIIDKICTALIISLIINSAFKNNITTLKISLLSIFGTLVSGTLFLGSALILVGLPGPFIALFMSAVLPATLLNAVVSVLIYRAFKTTALMKKNTI